MIRKLRQKPVAAVASAVVLLACSGKPVPLSAEPTPPAVAHLVVITVDGLRPEAISAAPAAHLQRLMRQSGWSLEARTQGTPETLPSHVSMVTGRDPDAHGVTWNTDKGGALDAPSLFTRVQQAGGKTVLLYGKSKMLMLAGPSGPDLGQGPDAGNANWDKGSDRALADRFASEFAQLRPQLALVHLRQPDFIGHKKRWMSAEYLAAVRESDEALGTILDAIEASGMSDRTAILLTADHGGEGDEHVRGSAASETIPWLCRVPGTAPGKIEPPPRTVDVAPTGLALLGLAPLGGIEGRTIKACLP